MAQLSHVERLDNLQKYLEAVKAGNTEEAAKFMKKIPLPPHLAAAMKTLVGSEELKRAGFNLSAAEQEYGKDWLAQ